MNQQNPNNFGFPAFINNSGSLDNNTTEIIGKVIANDKKALTGNEIIATVKTLYPTLFQSNQISDEAKLEIFKRVINSFAYPIGNVRWNFLTEKTSIRLCPGQTKYQVPDNYDSMIAVWLSKDCGLCKNLKIEVEYRSLERTNFEDDLNFWYKEGNDFIFSNLQVEKKLDLCNHCGECDSCKMFSGDINIHYFTTARQPQSLEDEIEWLPHHPSVKDYLVLKMTEEMKIMMGSEPLSISHNQMILDKYNSILQTEKFMYPVQNKSNNDFKKFDFSQIKRKFRI